MEPLTVGPVGQRWGAFGVRSEDVLAADAPSQSSKAVGTEQAVDSSPDISAAPAAGEPGGRTASPIRRAGGASAGGGRRVEVPSSGKQWSAWGHQLPSSLTAAGPGGTSQLTCWLFYFAAARLCRPLQVAAPSAAKQLTGSIF